MTLKSALRWEVERARQCTLCRCDRLEMTAAAALVVLTAVLWLVVAGVVYLLATRWIV